MKKLFLFTALITTVLCSSAFDVDAQSGFGNLFGRKSWKRRTNFQPYSSVSFGAGTSSYYGDLSPYSRFIPSTFKGMQWNLAFNYTRQLSPSFGLRFGLTWARIAGDDNKMEGVTGYDTYFIRNLHFRNDVKELSILGQLDLVPASKGITRRPKVVPYLFGGISIFAHDPMAKTPVGNGFSNEWVRLQPLHTEGQGLPGYAKPYSLIGVGIPLGLGLRYKLNQKFDLGVEVGYRVTFTDYLDDVGGNYADPADLQASGGALAVAMGNRTMEKTAAYSLKNRTQGVLNYLVSNNISVPANGDPFFLGYIPGFVDRTDPRGNSKLKDSYMLTSIKLIYNIPPKIKCPPTR